MSWSKIAFSFFFFFFNPIKVFWFGSVIHRTRVCSKYLSCGTIWCHVYNVMNRRSQMTSGKIVFFFFFYIPLEKYGKAGKMHQLHFFFFFINVISHLFWNSGMLSEDLNWCKNIKKKITKMKPKKRQLWCE